ncbi:protein NRT1/ PTR FAMILY 4.6-like isoform X2 [Neltuma alba]|uniref:protein NRT1/ PTR FAMILY 4.6-like isoform X2 n=1 Tax=Neltuma alba TaxID=207710 RepID=UPI0010A44E07|nr:protein NRT1/ PTR FAMILY 4.6-like isoform X2 [Prosopis alba]
MEVEDHQQSNRWEGYVDWRNKPALRGRHGGVEVLENLAYLANASNLVLYMRHYMHFSPSQSANNVTNFMGTAFLLALLGGFLSDAFFTSYHIFLTSAVLEFLGLNILTIQARSPMLKPPECDHRVSSTCQQVEGGKAAILFTGLYLVALGVGGIKGSLPSHGAEQFDETTSSGRKQISTFFNYFVFCLACGALIAVTFVVWVEDNKGWEWGFAISTISIFLSIPIFLAGSSSYRMKIPSGSPLTTIFKFLSILNEQVVVAASLNSCMHRNPSSAVVNMVSSPSNPNTSREEEEEEEEIKVVMTTETPSDSLRFLNNAVKNKPFHSSLECTVQQVEDVKIVVKMLPIFACTIMLNCCLAQLSTFSVQQAATMNTKLGSLKVPPASLPVFPVLCIMILAPIYDHIIIPFARKATRTEMGISHLRRIGIGLVLSTIAMAVAAFVEVKRKRVAIQSGLFNETTKPLPITFFWIALQYLFLGSADLFSLAGLLEFFFTEAPIKMRSLATSLSWASLAMGYYLSSVIVSVVNSVTGSSSHRPWLSGGNLNHHHLESFYWLMCVLNGLNFVIYLFWASRYKYRASGSSE